MRREQNVANLVVEKGKAINHRTVKSMVFRTTVGLLTFLIGVFASTIRLVAPLAKSFFVLLQVGRTSFLFPHHLMRFQRWL